MEMEIKSSPIALSPASENHLARLLRIMQYQAKNNQDFLDYTLSEAIGITESKIGYIYHYYEERQEFVLNTWSKDVMKECSVTGAPSCYELEKTGIWGEAVRQKKPIIINDFHQENPLKKGYPEGHVRLNKFMTTPVFSNDRIVGVVGVANKETDYTQEDLLHLQLLMDAVWKVLEARRNQESEQHVKNLLKGIRYINQLITKENDPLVLIRSACNSLTDTIGYFTAWIALFDKDMTVTHVAASNPDKEFSKFEAELKAGQLPRCTQKTINSTPNEIIFTPHSECRDCPVCSGLDDRVGLTGLLWHEGKIYGTMTVTAPREVAELKEQNDLFIQLAEDLGFAMHKINLERAWQELDQTLVEKERMMSTLVSNLPGLVYRCKMDQEWTMLYLSNGCSELTGYEPEELLMNKIISFNDLILPGYRNMLWEKWNRVIAEKAIFEDEYEIMTKDGITRWVWERGQGVYDSAGEVLFLEGFITDITQRRVAESRLKTSDMIFEHSLDMLCIAGYDGYFKVLNPAWSKVLGYTTEELLAEPWLTFVHPEDIEPTKNISSVILDGKEIYRFENRYICKDGSIKWLSWNSIPYPDEQIMFGIARDITEKKKTEDELQLQELKFRSLVKYSSDIIAMYGQDKTFLYASPGIKSVLGYEPGEIIGLKGHDLMKPEGNGSEIHNTADLSQIPRGEHIKYLSKAIHKDGSVKWLETTITNLLEEPGVRAIVGNYRDITEKVKSDLVNKVQYNIANSVVTAKNLNDLFVTVREELGKLMDTTNFIIAMFDDKEGTFTAPFEIDEKMDSMPTWPAANSISGLVIKRRASLLLKRKDILQLADQGEIILRGFRAESWLGVPLINKNRIIGVMILQSYSNPNAYDEAAQSILEIIANQLSIYIEQKEAELTAQKLSKAIIQNPATIVITDLKGNIEYVNPKFTQQTGYTLEEVTGRNPRILKSGYHGADFYKTLWDTILSGKDWYGELLDCKKNGDFYWESAIISPLVNDDGQVTHFIAVKEDITERKKMVEDLIQAKAQAESSDKLKSDFMNTISHEFRTPLNGITGFASLIMQPDSTQEEKMEYYQMMQSSTTRLLDTISDGMDASLITSGSLKPKITSINIKNLLEEIHDMYLPACLEKNIQFNLLKKNFSDNFRMNTDRELLMKVLRQLLDNSVKFTQTGSIDIECEVDQKFIRFQVKDTGVGMDKGILERLFKPFHQEETGSARSFEGSGLGLTIAKGIVNKLEGDIWVTTKKGEGSVFTFTLPFRAVQIPLEEIKPDLKPAKTDGIPVVLVAEDEDSNFYLIEALLRKANVKVIRALNGQEAVDYCLNDPEISLVLMDIKMPVMDGLEATRQIKDNRKQLPVIAITAHALTGDQTKILEAGCNDYISKPFRKETLWQKLNSAGIIPD